MTLHALPQIYLSPSPQYLLGMGPTRLELRCPGPCRWVYIEPDCSTTPDTLFSRRLP